MADHTLVTLTLYAEQHFPEDFAKLPPDDTCSIERGPALFGGEAIIRIGERGVAVVYENGDMVYEKNRIRNYEPFCWIQFSDNSNVDLRLNAFVRSYFVLSGYDGHTSCFKGDFLSQFKLACVDIAKGVRAKEEAQKGIANDRFQSQNLESRLEQLISTVDALKIESAISKQKALSSETMAKELEKQFEDFRTDSHTAKTEVVNDGVDWIKLFAASRIEVEELKAKLVNTQDQTLKLEIENAELRRRLLG